MLITNSRRIELTRRPCKTTYNPNQGGHPPGKTENLWELEGDEREKLGWWEKYW